MFDRHHAANAHLADFLAGPVTNLDEIVGKDRSLG